MNIRRYFCWLLGHRYKVIWFKNPYSHIVESQAGVADTEAGCVYCGITKPNEFPIQVSEIDWEATKHRTEPPKYNCIGGEQ